MADGVEDKVGYIMIERTSYLVGSDASLVFDQVDPSLGSTGFKEFFRTKHLFISFA